MPLPIPANNPHRRNPVSSSTTHNTTVVDAEHVLRVELFKNVHVNVPNLIDTMFGGARIEQLVAKVYDGLANHGILAKGAVSPGSKSSPWKGLSPNPSTENEIYEPLCTILNAITKVTQEHDLDALGVIWRDEHAHSVQSDFLEALRPDIVATFAPDQDNGTTTEDCAWWRLVHTPMEIKKRFGGKAAMLQLFNYVRQTLKEQPDRRFVFGLLFSRNCLTVWLADRTGVLGSSAFNIHTDPKRLITVIVGLLVKKPSELGWDPTMLAYVEDEDGRPMDPVPSYRLPRTKRADKSTTTAYHRKWVVEMNAPGQEDQNNPKMERFLLFRAVSLSHAEVIRGRSTRIWLAWKWDDVLDSKFTKETCKVYVFKDSWRDQRREQEGKLSTAKSTKPSSLSAEP
ncbi:hypothetical protein OF83DRAFT_1172958 [Amylostereum chailletii]|nr:hypothetical protein OF83DRAFT_1172958 [Amylostereum chailletii]